MPQPVQVDGILVAARDRTDARHHHFRAVIPGSASGSEDMKAARRFAFRIGRPKPALPFAPRRNRICYVEPVRSD
jgi:hypothetical protein